MTTSTQYVITSTAGMPNESHQPEQENKQQVNGNTDGQNSKPKFRSKYKHVAALHKISRPSILSHDSQEVPSFLGFRNLMVLTISEFGPC